MDKRTKHIVLSIILITVCAVFFNCAAGNEKFDTSPAGFWSGLWHGFICFFTFIISLFSKTVEIYEVNNGGGWYDFGFIIGASVFFGSGCGAGSKKKKKSDREKEWEEIGKKVEVKVRQGIKNWVDETGEDKKDGDEDWEEIGKKVEEKIKRELKKWAEE